MIEEEGDVAKLLMPISLERSSLQVQDILTGSIPTLVRREISCHAGW
jgi:hypothetical protein